MTLLKETPLVIKYTRVRGITCSASAQQGKVMGSMLGRATVVSVPVARSSARLIAKDVKSCTYSAALSKARNFLIRLLGMHWPKKGATYYHA